MEHFAENRTKEALWDFAYFARNTSIHRKKILEFDLGTYKFFTKFSKGSPLIKILVTHFKYTLKFQIRIYFNQLLWHQGVYRVK